jgi:hypothetical protein
VRVNFGVAGFQSRPILPGFGSLRVFGMPVARTDIASGLMAAKSLPSRLEELGVEDQLQLPR